MELGKIGGNWPEIWFLMQWPNHMPSDPELPARTGPAQFTTTHWSVVLGASQADGTQAADALEKLCRTYWYPLYAYARRRGYSAHDAEDLVQGFLGRLIEKRVLGTVERAGGRFRSFLLTAFNHFATDAHDRATRQKRGGGQEFISLDAQEAEERYHLEPADVRDPEKIFERRWALTVLEHVLQRLKAELDSNGQGRLFDRLQSLVVGERSAVPHAQIGSELGMSEGAVAVAVHRLRRRYRRLFQEEIAHTVAEPTEIETEVRHLISVLSGHG
jgi:RNA polymerase sigma-70 factor (ECF subfamily)